MAFMGKKGKSRTLLVEKPLDNIWYSLSVANVSSILLLSSLIIIFLSEAASILGIFTSSIQHNPTKYTFSKLIF